MRTTVADTPATTHAQISGFLEQKRIAMVGVSREPRDFSRMLMHEFEVRGYEVVPVNPNASEIGSHPCFPRVQDIRPPVTAALVITSSTVSANVVRDCAAAGVKQVWLHRGGGMGAVTPEAISLCQEHGISVVAGECPFMFLPKTAFFHRIHGAIRKILGKYPR